MSLVKEENVTSTSVVSFDIEQNSSRENQIDAVERSLENQSPDPELSTQSNIEHSNDNNSILSDMTLTKKKWKVPWYYAPAFLLFWLVLFFAVVIPIFFHLPTGLSIEEEQSHAGEFIGERAERILFEFEMIGEKVVGSYANENITVQLLYDKIAKIRRVMHEDLFDMEVDLQVVNGMYMRYQMMNVYQGVQNFVVKFSAKNVTSQSYLLINSHFDSKPGSPGTGDDGAMLVVMLEVLRVLATTRQIFDHPIVFLFNGAEENPLQASHGFITQHKWAKNCKALINLDSAGSGNREILFQSGPNHPWLMNYYNKYVKRPFATTFAEEVFQANIIPSDTDFRIFKDHGHLPGLDFAHTYNGYVYHTKFDRYNVIPRGSLQATGDNILALTRAFADAQELEDPSKHAEGHTVFYDFVGLFVIYYTETAGKIINACIAVATILIVCVSLWRMAATSYLSLLQVTRTFSLLLVLHLVGLVLAFGLPLLMAVIYDSDNRSLTWFTHKWLVIGLYICPSLLGMSAPALIFLSLSRNDKISKQYQLQMVLHAHNIILALICIVITFAGLRSSYMFMIALLFYTCALILNLITTLHDRGYYWTILLMLSQIMPFLYISYLLHAFLCTLIPMMGRFGSSLNPDLLIGGLCAMGTVLAMGFLIPLLSIFRRPKLIVLSLAIITFLFAMLSITPLGFPYRAKTHVQRTNFLRVRRVFYDYEQNVERNESGFYFDFQDRRMERPLLDSVDLEDLQDVADDCNDYMMCGFPLFNYRWVKSKNKGKWLPTKEPTQLPGPTANLTLLQKTVDEATGSVRLEFQLEGPPHMSLFVQPLSGVSISEWSPFLRDMLDQPDEWQPPYHLFLAYGKDSTPWKFSFNLKYSGGNNLPLLELGLSAHYVSNEHRRDEATTKFVQSFPQWSYIMEWASSYERYLF